MRLIHARRLALWIAIGMTGWPAAGRAEESMSAPEAAPASVSTPSAEAEALLLLLDAKDLYVQQKAFLQLEALREPATGRAIREHLKSRRAPTRVFSARALAAVERAAAVPTLLDVMKKDRDPRVRLASLLAVEPLQDPVMLPALIDRLRDRNAQVRIAAVDVVSRVDHPLAREAILRRWKRERHRDVQRVLQAALTRMGLPLR